MSRHPLRRKAILVRSLNLKVNKHFTVPLFTFAIVLGLLNGCATEQNSSTSSQPEPAVSKPLRLGGQCVGISKFHLDEMKKLNLQGRRYLYYCNLCNPKSKNPDNPRTIVQLSSSRYDDTTWTFNFGEGRPVDAADIYIESTPNHFLSLSKLISCSATLQKEIWDMKSKKK
jgi:hypothetical protein